MNHVTLSHRFAIGIALLLWAQDTRMDSNHGADGSDAQSAHFG
jgi:hypothetical protein